MKAKWCPEALCVSFKLETDIKILESKARGSIAKYGMDLVVANELHSRRVKALIYNKKDLEVCECKPDEYLEDKIVNSIVAAHNKYAN